MMPAVRPGRLPLAAWYAAIGVPIAVSYAFVHWTVYQQTVYHLLAFAVPVALLYGVRRYRPAGRGPWYLMVVGMTVSASADMVFDGYGWLGRSIPFPSFADPMYIVGELVLIAGILALSVRASRGSARWLLDWAVVGVAGGLLVYVFVIGPVIDTPGTALERAVAASYPSLDVALLIALVPLVLVRTRNAALLAILGYGVITLAGDMVYAHQLLHDTYVDGGQLDVTWLLAFVALAAAGLMPSLAHTTVTAVRGWDDWSRLVVLGVSTAVVFVVVALTPPSGGDEYVVSVIVGALVLVLVFSRVALLHAERRASEARLTRETGRLDAFEEVQRTTSEEELELDQLLQLVCDKTVSLISGGVVIALTAGSELVVRASRGRTAMAPGVTIAPRSLSRAAVEADAVLICEDVDHDDRVDVELARSAGIRSLAAAPVHYGSAAVGAIVATSPELARFDGRVARTLEVMAALVSDAISRSSEFAARRALEAIVESSDDAIIGSSFDGAVVSWNAGAEQMYGYTAEEIVGRSITTVVPLELHGEADAFQARLARGESIAPYETEGLTKDGRRITVSVSLSPVRDFGGRVVGASVIARDITERRRLEQELHQSQKLEAVGRLAGGIAHDFNNLLLAIQGYASLVLARVGDDDATSRRYIEQVLVAARQSADLTQQLLAYSRKQVLQPTVVDLNDVVGEIEGMLGRLIGEDIELACELDPDVGAVLVDRSRLAQVVMNLGVNARDSITGHGRLLIATEAATVEPGGSVSAGGAPPGRYAKLVVRDTGGGMDAETLGRIFDPFFTTKAEGTGLGLSTVQGTVSQSGGFIAVESEPGRGTAFEIYLPEHAAPAPVVDEPSPGDRQHAPQHGRVLLVEDMPAVRDVVGDLLASAGYEVLTAASGAEALALARREPFDLLLTDVVMPGMNGVELARRLREQQPGIAVILTSGYPDGSLGEDEPPADSIFLQKPYTLDELRAATEAALAAYPAG